MSETQGNVIQIKRGKGIPEDNVLAEGELGLDLDSKQLIVGVSVSDGQGTVIKPSGIRVAQATGAQKIIDNFGDGMTVGTKETPIFLSNGQFKTCSGATISGTIEKAEMLAERRSIGVDLSLKDFAWFNGQSNIVTGVTGVLPITKGGTGATTVDDAIANFGLDSRYLKSDGSGYINNGTVDSNTTKWAITIEGTYGKAPNGGGTSSENPPVGWGNGIKFIQGWGQNNLEGRFSGIIGYADTYWANLSGLKFVTSNLAGQINGTATFVAGTFTSPILATTNYDTTAPSGSPRIGSLYFQVVG